MVDLHTHFTETLLSSASHSMLSSFFLREEFISNRKKTVLQANLGVHGSVNVVILRETIFISFVISFAV